LEPNVKRIEIVAAVIGGFLGFANLAQAQVWCSGIDPLSDAYLACMAAKSAEVHAKTDSDRAAFRAKRDAEIAEKKAADEARYAKMDRKNAAIAAAADRYYRCLQTNLGKIEIGMNPVEVDKTLGTCSRPDHVNRRQTAAGTFEQRVYMPWGEHGPKTYVYLHNGDVTSIDNMGR
jgi:hypothetical protein